MSTPVAEVLVYALIPAAAAVGGGTLAAYRPPAPTTRSSVQHIAAGVVFAAVAGELLPEILRIHRPAQVAIGFAFGIALMLLVRHFAERAEKASSNGSRGLVTVVGIDMLVDGLIVGIGFAAGTETGVLIVVALTLEVLFLGVASASELSQAGRSRQGIIGTTTGLAFLLMIGAAMGAFALQGLSDSWLEALLGFGAAALLYLVTEELLVEAHEVRETPVTTAFFFAGFLALLIIEMIA